LTHPLRIFTQNQNDPFAVIHHATARVCYFALEKNWGDVIRIGDNILCFTLKIDEKCSPCDGTISSFIPLLEQVSYIY